MPKMSNREYIKLLMRRVDTNGLMLNEEIGRCWAWTGSKRDGYSVCGRHLAHDVSHRLFKGDVPEGSHVAHICNNRECINPEHLKVETE
jgi:hypothetical protein